MNILLLNQGHTDNLGDKAILQVMKQFLHQNGNMVISKPFIAYEPPSLIVCRSKNIQKTVCKKTYADTISIKQRFNCLMGRLLPNVIVYLIREKKAIRKILGQEKKIDAAIIGGGELLKSRHQFTYAFFAWVFYLKKICKCPIAIWGISGDEKFSFLDKVIYRYVLKNCCYVGVRDKKTACIVEELFRGETEYAPDVVFALRTLYPVAAQKKDNSVVCFLNSFAEVDTVFVSEEKYFEEFSKLIPEKATKIELGFTTQADYDEAIKLKNYLKKNEKYKQIDIYVGETVTVEALVNSINSAGTVVSGRMHPMIIGLQLHKVVIPFAVKQKLVVFNEEWKDVVIDCDVMDQIDYQMQHMMSTLRKEERGED